MRFSAVLLILTGLACSAGTGEAAGSGAASKPQADRWKIDFKLSLSEKKGKWVFAVDGFTDLPAEARLRARVYVVNVVNSPFDGPREDDDEALVRDDDGLQAALCRFKAGSGWFHQEVHAFSRKPYSIRYRAKISCLPEEQTPADSLRIGNDPVERSADLRVGTESDYSRELGERLQEAARQLMTLEKAGHELRAHLEKGAPNPAAWAAWKERALPQVDVVRDENRERFALWAVWIEGQSRMRVGALCEFFQHLVAAVDEGNREIGTLRERVGGYLESIEEAVDVLGADVPLNPQQARSILADYEKALAPLRDPAAPAPAALRRAHAESLASLFDLTLMLRVRRRGYIYVSQVGDRLARVFDLFDGRPSAEERAGALREHDAALREFRLFARLD